MAVVLTLVQAKQIIINIHKREQYKKHSTEYFCPLQGTEINMKKNLGKIFYKIVVAELLADSEVFTATTFSSKSDVWLTVHRNSVWIRKTN